jgi:hypothetical protein
MVVVAGKRNIVRELVSWDGIALKGDGQSALQEAISCWEKAKGKAELLVSHGAEVRVLDEEFWDRNQLSEVLLRERAKVSTQQLYIALEAAQRSGLDDCSMAEWWLDLKARHAAGLRHEQGGTRRKRKV